MAEIQKGIRDVLELENVFNCKPAVFRAYKYAKNFSKGGGVGGEYVEFKEFRVFLLALRQYFEYYEAFDTIDTSNDRRITLDEFRWGQKILQKWVGKIASMEDEFKKIDKNSGGFILFDEFCDWAIEKGLKTEQSRLNDQSWSTQK